MGALQSKLNQEHHDDYFAGLKQTQATNASFREDSERRDKENRRLQLLRDLDCCMRVRDAMDGLSHELREAMEVVLYPKRRTTSLEEFTVDRIKRMQQELRGIDPLPTPKAVLSKERSARRSVRQKKTRVA